MDKKHRSVDVIEQAEQTLYNAVVITEMAMDLREKDIAAAEHSSCLAARSSKTVSAMRNTGKSFVNLAYKIVASNAKLTEKLPPSEPASHCLKLEYEKLLSFLEKEVIDNEDLDAGESNSQDTANVNLPFIAEKIRSLESRHKSPETSHLISTSSFKSLKQDVNERYPESYCKESLIDLENAMSLPPLPEDTFSVFPRSPVKSSSMSSLKSLRNVQCMHQAESEESDDILDALRLFEPEDEFFEDVLCLYSGKLESWFKSNNCNKQVEASKRNIKQRSNNFCKKIRVTDSVLFGYLFGKQEQGTTSQSLEDLVRLTDDAYIKMVKPLKRQIYNKLAKVLALSKRSTLMYKIMHDVKTNLENERCGGPSDGTDHSTEDGRSFTPDTCPSAIPVMAECENITPGRHVNEIDDMQVGSAKRIKLEKGQDVQEVPVNKEISEDEKNKVLENIKEESSGCLKSEAQVEERKSCSDTCTDVCSKNNPYAYIHRQEFTSETFKIIIRGFPKHVGMAELKKLLKAKLGASKIKVPQFSKQRPIVYANFRNEEDKDNALKTLNGYMWKNKVALSAEPAKPAPDPLVRKRQEMRSESDVAKAAESTEPPVPMEKRLQVVSTPWCDIAYEEQLQKKFEQMKNVVDKMAQDIRRINPELKGWFQHQCSINNGFPVKMLDIKRSPVCNGYRNKCEFAIGLNSETSKPTVGFRLGSYKDGSKSVGPVASLKHIPDKMKDVAQVFENFVLDSDKPPYDPETYKGFWRQLTVRLSRKGDLMVIIVMHPQSLTDEELAKVKEELKVFFTEGEGKALNVTSLYFQAFDKIASGQKKPEVEHLSGTTHIEETLLGLTFQISPAAFFQINTSASETLYEEIAEVAGLTENTSLLDICCRTGTIGLCLSKHCKEVLGIELVPEAVKDAVANAERNSISNCQFFAGKAEDILSSVVMRAMGEDVVAVVDPPRSGIHQKTTTVLRKAKRLRKLAYVSCDPKSAMKNFLDLCRPASKTFYGDPFVPVMAVPVDMFPHTSHCEMIIYFERKSEEELEKYEESSSKKS